MRVLSILINCTKKMKWQGDKNVTWLVCFSIYANRQNFIIWVNEMSHGIQKGITGIVESTSPNLSFLSCGR